MENLITVLKRCYVRSTVKSEWMVPFGFRLMNVLWPFRYNHNISYYGLLVFNVIILHVLI